MPRAKCSFPGSTGRTSSMQDTYLLFVSRANTLRRRSIADVFRVQVISNPDVRSPDVTLGSTSFFHIRHENLYVVAVTKCNANAALVFEFCSRVVKLCVSYFGKMDEEAIKNNFTL